MHQLQKERKWSGLVGMRFVRRRCLNRGSCCRVMERLGRLLVFCGGNNRKAVDRDDITEGVNPLASSGEAAEAEVASV